jgi:hypothetical protein
VRGSVAVRTRGADNSLVALARLLTRVRLSRCSRACPSAQAGQCSANSPAHSFHTPPTHAHMTHTHRRARLSLPTPASACAARPGYGSVSGFWGQAVTYDSLARSARTCCAQPFLFAYWYASGERGFGVSQRCLLLLLRRARVAEKTTMCLV